MAALSIAIVQAEARDKVSKHLTLVRLNSKNCFQWVFADGTTRNVQEIPVDKIRGIKLEEWLRYARGLVEGKAVEGAPPIVINAPVAAAPIGPAGGPNPSFMRISHKQTTVPFDPDPEKQGYRDATRGITANPYGKPGHREAWERGHDRAFSEGVAEKARFGRTAGKRN